MSGTRNLDWRASALLSDLLLERGWTARDLQEASASTGHPDRTVSFRSVYRVLSDGHIPTAPVQFEIAAALGLSPRQIWGRVPIPDEVLLGGVGR